MDHMASATWPSVSDQGKRSRSASEANCGGFESACDSACVDQSPCLINTGQVPTHPVTRLILAGFIGNTACDTRKGIWISPPQVARQVAIERIMAGLLPTDTKYESIVSILRRSPGPVCAVADRGAHSKGVILCAAVQTDGRHRYIVSHEFRTCRTALYPLVSHSERQRPEPRPFGRCIPEIPGCPPGPECGDREQENEH